MKRTIKRAILVLSITAIAILVALAFRPQPLHVETARVVRGPLQVTIDEDGETRAHDRYTLAAPVAGRLSRIELHEGDPVTPSIVIATITPLPLDPRETADILARVQSAEALSREAQQQVARRETDLEQARRELKRTRELSKNGLVPTQTLDNAQSTEAASAKEWEAAIARAQSAAAEVKRAQAGLISLEARRGVAGKTTPVRPPSSGRVLRILEKSDRVVSAGTPLLVLSNPNRLEIVVDLLSADAVKAQAGAPVSIENWGGPAPLRGRVRQVEPYGYTKVSALGIEEQRVDVIIDFADPPTGLGDGYRVDVRIVIWESPSVLKTPVSALFRVGESWNVFRIERERAVRRTVGVGYRNAIEAEITTGLDVGNELILHPASELKDGARVTTK